MIDMIYNFRQGDIHAAEFSDEFTLKTEASVRTLPLIPHIERMLIEQQKEEMYSKLLKSDFDRTYEGFVCRDAYGKLITPNFVSDHFKNMVKKYGLRKLRFHDLRYSCASLLLANGVSMKAIQDWLGHSTFNVTANFYSHLDYKSRISSAEVQGYDLLLGGSPCTYWSIAKKDREVDCNGEGFRLFKEYVRALEESGCKYFLYENNYSVHQRIKDEISKTLGVEPIMINSSLVSAQNRKRCYWTNIPFASFPADKGILLKDVLESGVAWQDKSYCMTASYDGAVLYNTLERKQRTMVAEPIPINTYQGTDKSRTVMAGYHKYGEATIIKNPGFNGGTTAVATPVRIGHYGKGGQGQRIYSVVGKSVTLSANGGGQGAKTGLYKIDLPDGDYVIRKLTPVEAERLQTLPDNYTAGISNTQRYKCIGNGWTVDVIAHILGGLHDA